MNSFCENIISLDSLFNSNRTYLYRSYPPCRKAETEHPHNLQLFCSDCNRSKEDHTIAQERAATPRL